MLPSGEVSYEDTVMTLDRFRDRITKRVDFNPDSQLVVNAADAAPYDCVVRALDTTTQCGVKQLTLMDGSKPTK